MASNTIQEDSKICGRFNVWDFTKCSHSVKIRKDFKLTPKLFACIGGDYQINQRTIRPHLTFVYQCDEKVALTLTKSELVLSKKMTASIGGAMLDFSPRFGLQLDDALKPNLCLQVNNLRPWKAALGCLFVGVAIGTPIKTKKILPLKPLPKSSTDAEAIQEQSQFGCEVAVGAQRTGPSISVPFSEVNALVQLGPKLL